MATGQLTERQQEVQTLLDKGKTPNEIAKALKISPNAIYQQIRRIRKAQGKRRSTAQRSSTARRTSGRKSGSSRSSRSRPSRPAATPPTPQPNIANTVTQRPMTPLQAIRTRRSEIEAELAESGHHVQTAAKAVQVASERHDKLMTRYAAEQAQLEAAENALTGKTAKATRKRSSRKASNNGSGSKGAAQATPAPAEGAKPAEATPEPEQAAQDAAAPAPDAAPGPAVSEEEAAAIAADASGGDFAQPEDGFGEE